MTRARLKYGIDLGLFVSGTICIVTGIIKFPELIRFFNRTGLVLNYNRISLAHDWSGIVLTILVVAHITLNWRWMVTMTKVLIRPTPRIPEE